MKALLISLFSLLVVFGAVAQDEASKSGPVITFDEATFDFGDITQGDKVEHVFAFENTGNEPLIITNVQTTCGCTAPNWPKDPIMPGQRSEMKVVFNSTGKNGRQNKVITVISNATNNTERVSIVTNVLPKSN